MSPGSPADDDDVAATYVHLEPTAATLRALRTPAGIAVVRAAGWAEPSATVCHAHCSTAESLDGRVARRPGRPVVDVDLPPEDGDE